MTEELQLRNFSEVTIKTYVRVVQRFAKHFGKSPEKLGAEQVRQYPVVRNYSAQLVLQQC
jgi:integrase/recombinase XerD